MKRPCHCDQFRPGEPLDITKGDCAICWNYHNRPGYKELWNEVEEPPPKRREPLPVEQWPWFARAITQLASVEDKGLGDTIHRHLARFGADAVTKVYRRLVGKDCGCKDRQERLNRLFPYLKPKG